MTNVKQIDDALRAILTWKEQSDADHIRAAARDGCECDLCQAARSAAGSTLPEGFL